MTLRFFVLSLLALATTLQAQQVTLGVEGGVPAQTPAGSTDRVPFAIGPTLHLRFNPSLSLQTGFLFPRLGLSRDSFVFRSSDNAVTSGEEQRRGRAIEIPLLLKYTLLDDDRNWRPFLAAGASIRRTFVDYVSAASVLSPQPLTPSVQLNESERVQWNVDPTFGAGVSFRSERLILEPQVRYSYWGAGKDTGIRKNQVQFLFGLRF